MRDAYRGALNPPLARKRTKSSILVGLRTATGSLSAAPAGASVSARSDDLLALRRRAYDSAIAAEILQPRDDHLDAIVRQAIHAMAVYACEMLFAKACDLERQIDRLVAVIDELCRHKDPVDAEIVAHVV